MPRETGAVFERAAQTLDDLGEFLDGYLLRGGRYTDGSKATHVDGTLMRKLDRIRPQLREIASALRSRDAEGPAVDGTRIGWGPEGSLLRRVQVMLRGLEIEEERATAQDLGWHLRQHHRRQVLADVVAVLSPSPQATENATQMAQLEEDRRDFFAVGHKVPTQKVPAGCTDPEALDNTVALVSR